jgi:hypothetical protein
VAVHPASLHLLLAVWDKKMEPLKPLGRPLSDVPFKESLSKNMLSPGPSAGDTISVFDWYKLAKGTWKFLIKPLWKLLTFPFKFAVLMREENVPTNRNQVWEEQTKRMNPDLYK